MLINRKTRPICHGRMGKGNNLCSRVIARVLAETLLRAVKSKANRDVTSRRDCHSTVLVHKTPDKFAKKVGNGNWNMAIQASCKYQFWHRLGEFKWRRSAMRIVVVMLVFIVHCNVCDTTCCCVLFQFFFSFSHVHCLCPLCVAPTFSFEGMKNFLTWHKSTEAKINVPTTNRWKAKLAITNLN